MFDKSNLIRSAAVVALGGALLASPALAQRIGGGRTGGGAPSAGVAAHVSTPGSGSNGAANGVNAAPMASSAARTSGTNAGFSGNHFAANTHHGDHHHHRGFGGGFAFYGAPYDYDYYNDWAYQPDCTMRHVRIHRHWVWRQYCN
jgi:hypothetical protein